jgi:hypothetical protein
MRLFFYINIRILKYNMTNILLYKLYNISDNNNYSGNSVKEESQILN